MLNTKSDGGSRGESGLALRTDTRDSGYLQAESELARKLGELSIPENEICENLMLFTTPQQLRRILFLSKRYAEILSVPGIILQFGVRWGRELALFEALRTIHEPFNHSRRIVGFDTFDGYPEVSPKDGVAPMMKAGNLSTSASYFAELTSLLRCREQLSPIPHVQKFDLIQGDVRETLPRYLDANPHTVVSMVHFDLNLYEPTRVAMELVKPRLTRGSVVIVDEVNCKTIPGETLALDEVFGMNKIRLRRDEGVGPTWPAYFSFGE